MEKSSNEGWSALAAGNLEDAERGYEAAIKHAREGHETLAEALFRSYRGLVRRGMGRLVEARQDMEHALAIANAEDSLQLIGHVQFLLAELDFDAGDDSKGIDRLLIGLDAALECNDADTAELAFARLGLVYLDYGALEPAHECFTQALAQRPEGPNRASLLGNIGQTLAEMGQLEESIHYYRLALKDAKNIGDIHVEAKCIASEGLSHFQQQQYAQAIECYKQALAIAQQEDDLASKSTWLGNLGNVYLRLGQADQATQLAEEGLQLAKRLHDRRSEAAHLDTLGDCWLEKGDYEKALSHYNNALDIGKSLRDKVGERVYLANVARAYKRLGKTDESLKHFRQAIKMFDEQRSFIASDTKKTSFAATGQNLYRDTIQALLEADLRIEALEYVGRAKSRAILDLLRNSPIDISELEQVDDQSLKQLVARERELSMQIARLERIYAQGPGEPESGHRGTQMTADDAPRLYRERREIIDQLRRRHPNYANMVSVDSLSFDELRSLWTPKSGLTPAATVLSDHTAIFEFFMSDEFLFAAGIWSGCDKPATSIITDSKELAALLRDLADYLEMSSTEGWEVPISLCKRLYKRLLAPLMDALPPAIDRLILVPHGVLHRLPFAAFHNGKHFLIERFSLSYLPTSSLVPVLASQTPQEQGEQLSYLVSAISDYSATRNDGIVFSSRLRSAAGLEDLSYTLEEAQTVHQLANRHAGESKLLTNNEVKEGLLSLFSDYPVVHFAGHAVFNPEEPLASGLVLSDGSILTAARILQDNVLRTKCGKLLVLSACQTGVNVVTNGGEILGLARALIYAGMPNLILSLWEVADRSTSDLMTNFHNAWQAGKTSIAHALAEAQRAAVEEHQPIHAWAPFIHLGID
ncbi:MAG TPA: CHAT domain-containing tetratricopeptide repeat protein [Candidatus Obscuribacterales bacterium]